MRTLACLAALSVSVLTMACALPADPNSGTSSTQSSNKPDQIVPTTCRRGEYDLEKVDGKGLPALGWRLPSGEEVRVDAAYIFMHKTGYFMEQVSLSRPDGTSVLGHQIWGRYSQSGCQIRNPGINQLYEASLTFATDSDTWAPSFSFSGTVSGLFLTAYVHGYPHRYIYRGPID